MKIIKFERDKGGETLSFHQDLRARVEAYFSTNNLRKQGDFRMKLKSIVLILGFFIPYVLILLNFLPTWGMALLTVVMGIFTAGLGMSVMHDACHNSYSSNPYINRFMGYTLNLIGGNRFNWIVQHNVKHHTFTNVYGADEDIETGNLIRLSPYSPYKWFHKFQHIYSWFLYLLGTFSWVTYKDFVEFNDMYRDKAPTQRRSYWVELTILILSKAVYFGYLVVIPYLLLDLPFWYIIIGFLIIHFVAGFILTVTFQLAHVVENTEHGSAEHSESAMNTWAVHQVKTTSNFARKSRLLNWYLGGLNFQIEHHLFPNICHIHYKKLSEIVRKTVQDHGLSYNDYENVLKAIRSHYLTLKRFGQKDSVMA
jgi:linoleoyl-CoA desaturase